MIWVVLVHSLVGSQVLLHLSLLLFVVFLQRVVSAPEAGAGENHLDEGYYQESSSLHSAVNLVFNRLVLDVLDDLGEVVVASPFHYGKDEEEVDAHEGSHGAVEPAEGLEHTHFTLIIY